MKRINDLLISVLIFLFVICACARSSSVDSRPTPPAPSPENQAQPQPLPTESEVGALLNQYLQAATDAQVRLAQAQLVDLVAVTSPAASGRVADLQRAVSAYFKAVSYSQTDRSRLAQLEENLQMRLTQANRERRIRNEWLIAATSAAVAGLAYAPIYAYEARMALNSESLAYHDLSMFALPTEEWAALSELERVPLSEVAGIDFEASDLAGLRFAVEDEFMGRNYGRKRIIVFEVKRFSASPFSHYVASNEIDADTAQTIASRLREHGLPRSSGDAGVSARFNWPGAVGMAGATGVGAAVFYNLGAARGSRYGFASQPVDR